MSDAFNAIKAQHKAGGVSLSLPARLRQAAPAKAAAKTTSPAPLKKTDEPATVRLKAKAGAARRAAIKT